MANLRTAMDAAFWDLSMSTPQTLDGTARSIPGEPFPMDGARAARALRIQQLSLLGNGFPLGIIPSYSPTSQKELGPLTLQSLLLKPATYNWWLGLIGQVRPEKLISSIKAEVRGRKEWDLQAYRSVARHFLDKSLYAVGLCSQIALAPMCSIFFSTEKHGERIGRRTKAMLFHKLPDHDITLEAAWPELFIDHKGNYWEIPESISLDCSSLVSESGLRYRFGLHKNKGPPEGKSSSDGEVPLALLPGLCAKAAFSYEKSMDLWRREETEDDVIIKTDKGRFYRPSYDIRLREPHVAISGIMGATCAAWLGGAINSSIIESGDANVSSRDAKRRAPFSANLFGSACCTVQLGTFRKFFGDLTRLDARLDIGSASALGRSIINIFRNSSISNAENLRSSPRLNLTFQQQVLGPIVFRLDSRYLLDSSGGRSATHLEDFIYSLSYSLRLLHSGKVVAWYSPKRKEGMIELRLFEF